MTAAYGAGSHSYQRASSAEGSESLGGRSSAIVRESLVYTITVGGKGLMYIMIYVNDSQLQLYCTVGVPFFVFSLLEQNGCTFSLRLYSRVRLPSVCGTDTCTRALRLC